MLPHCKPWWIMQQPHNHGSLLCSIQLVYQVVLLVLSTLQLGKAIFHCQSFSKLQDLWHVTRKLWKNLKEELDSLCASTSLGAWSLYTQYITCPWSLDHYILNTLHVPDHSITIYSIHYMSLITWSVYTLCMLLYTLSYMYIK